MSFFSPLFFFFFPVFFYSSPRERYILESYNFIPLSILVSFVLLMAKFRRRAIFQWQSKRSDEMEFTPLYLSLKLNLFISKSWNELLLPPPIVASFRVKAWNGAKLPSLRSTFLLTINAIDLDARDPSRDRFKKERERERAKRTILEISFPFSRSPVLASFLVGKKEKSRQNHREETQFVEIGSNSRPLSFLSLSLSLSPFHPFLSRYFHSDHEVYLSRCAYSRTAGQKYTTFKPNLSVLSSPESFFSPFR